MNLDILWKTLTADGQTQRVELFNELYKWLEAQADQPTEAFLIGRNDHQPTENDLDALKHRIVRHFTPMTRSYQICRALTDLIDQGNQRGLWQLTPPGIPVLREREASPFLREAMPSLAQVRQWRSGLENFVNEFRQKHLTEKRGAILACAALYGGALDTNVLRALYQKLGEPLDLVRGLSSISLSLRWRGQDDMEERRWFPDALTELLWLGLTPEDMHAHQCEMAGERVSTQDVWKAIKGFFRVTIPEKDLRPRNISQFLEAIVLEFKALRAPSGLVDYGSRSFVSHSLKDLAWQRLQGLPLAAEQVVETDANEEKSSPESYMPDESEPIQFEFVWMTAVRQALKLKDEKAAADQLNTIRESVANNADPIACLFIDWARFMCQGCAASGKRISLSTVRGYFGSVSTRLIGFSGSEDLSTFSLESLESLYGEIMEDAQSRSNRRKLARGLREFHHYLQEKHCAGRLNVQAVLGIGMTLALVDANVISFDEYQAIWDAFDDYDLERLHPDLPTVARLIFMIAFRCGLRRMEVLFLRLKDVHELGMVEVLVRPHESRRLKTLNSTRKLPLYALMSDDEQELLSKWVEKRQRQEEASPTRHGFLFSIPERGYVFVPEETIFPRLHHIMREVTGDPSIRFHHLRHSFASWTFLRLMLSDLDQIPDWFPHLPITSQVLKDSKRFRERLYGHAHITRKHIYAVASLLGHSGPAMSVEHYIHFFDLVYSATLQESIQQPKGVLVAASGLSSSTAYRNLREGGVNQLLTKARAKNSARVRRHWPAKVTKPVKQEVEIPLAETLDRVWRLLYIHSTKSVDVEQLADRFEFSKSQCESMIAAAIELGAITSPNQKASYRHRMTFRQLQSEAGIINQRLSCPVKPSKGKKERVFEYLARPLGRILETSPLLLDKTTDHYARHVWKTRYELVFHNETEVGMGRDFLELFKKLGVPRQAMDFAVYGDSKEGTYFKFWCRELRLKPEQVRVRPSTNPESEGVSRWFSMKPNFSSIEGLSGYGIYGYRFLLIMTWIYLKALKVRSDALGETKIPDS